MKILLEKIDLKYAEGIAKALSDNEIADNLRDLPSPYTARNAREFINYITASDQNINFVFAITLDGKFAGCISATRGQNIHYRTAEIGYYVCRELWSKGIATTALSKLCEYIFKNTDIIRLYAEPFARNKASCRVLEKAGFSYEGTLRQNAVKCGKIEDMCLYSKLK